MFSQHSEDQREAFDVKYSEGARPHITSKDPLVKYLISWRIKTAVKKLQKYTGSSCFDFHVLVLCSGEGGEGTILCDLGFKNVVVSDISSSAVNLAVQRDPRLNGLVINVERSGLEASSYDLVLVQDGLHHLQNPVGGFVEMLRIARECVMFFEPHDSLAGRLFGNKWEKNGEAVNYVFRWKKTLVQAICNSFLGEDSFSNQSFSFWHHNVLMERFMKRFIKDPKISTVILKLFSSVINRTLGLLGNQFCGLIVKIQK